MRSIRVPILLCALALGQSGPALSDGLLESRVDPHTIRTVDVQHRSQTRWTVAIDPLSLDHH